MDSPGGSVVTNLPANAGNETDTSSISGWGRSPGIGNGNPLQYSCLENYMDRGTLGATVHGVSRSQTWLSMHTHVLKQKPNVVKKMFFLEGKLSQNQERNQ